MTRCVRSARFVCRCANASRAKYYGKTSNISFGVQFFGECWISHDAEDRYNLYDRKQNCMNSQFQRCLDNSKKTLYWSPKLKLCICLARRDINDTAFDDRAINYVRASHNETTSSNYTASNNNRAFHNDTTSSNDTTSNNNRASHNDTASNNNRACNNNTTSFNDNKDNNSSIKTALYWRP
ncbi:hypothetical protein ABFA07_014345 [Porites harrisoni]